VIHRPGLADLDLELTALSLLAVGEQGARLLVSEPEAFTAERSDASPEVCSP